MNITYIKIVSRVFALYQKKCRTPSRLNLWKKTMIRAPVDKQNSRDKVGDNNFTKEFSHLFLIADRCKGGTPANAFRCDHHVGGRLTHSRSDTVILTLVKAVFCLDTGVRPD
jgi:hypothetical protein